MKKNFKCIGATLGLVFLLSPLVNARTVGSKCENKPIVMSYCIVYPSLNRILKKVNCNPNGSDIYPWICVSNFKAKIIYRYYFPFTGQTINKEEYYDTTFETRGTTPESAIEGMNERYDDKSIEFCGKNAINNNL